jgi:membrane protein implicated in regulation of membrane protease activity
MWILQFIPDWVFHGMFLIGIFGLAITYILKFLSFFPFLYVYKTTIQIVSIALIAIATYMSGAAYNNDIWLTRAKKLQEKIDIAEQQSKEENVKIVEKVVKRTEYIKTRGDDIIKYVEREITKYDNQCILPKDFIDVLNRAAEEPTK